MIGNSKSKNSFPELEKPFKEFKGKMLMLRKKQSLILNNFSQKVTAKKIDQINKKLSK